MLEGRGSRSVSVFATSLVLATTLFLSVVATGCDPVSRTWAWTAGDTHGAVIETTAGRASLEIYRVPTRKLYDVYVHARISGVEAVLWAYGKPPAVRKTFSYGGRSLTLEFGAATSALRSVAHRAIFDRSSDLIGALADAWARNTCLALTLVSFGEPGLNWTQKKLDCRNGSLP